MANVKISELKKIDSPSTSATLVGVDSGETVQIPTSVFQGQIDYINMIIREDLIDYDAAVKNGGQSDSIDISSPEAITIRTKGDIFDPNTLIVSPSSGITLNSNDNIDIVSNSIHISNSYDYEAGVVIDYRNTDLHCVGKLYAKDDDEGLDTMPAGCVLTSGDGNKIRWSNEYVHSDDLDPINQDIDYIKANYLTGETVFHVDGVATEKYVDDEISATLGTILATLNRI